MLHTSISALEKNLCGRAPTTDNAQRNVVIFLVPERPNASILSFQWTGLQLLTYENIFSTMNLLTHAKRFVISRSLNNSKKLHLL